MQCKGIAGCIYITMIFALCLSAQTITKNHTGTQGDYCYEYWLDYADIGKSGTMTLGDDGNFSCSWDSVNNILFKKGKRPGAMNQIITYSADYNPSGISCIGAYGWTKDPMIEYYIVESWGTWKPPGVTSKGTIISDSGVYDIYEKYLSHLGVDPIRQFWSVRQNKRTSGTITCANHFDAWAAKNMVLGELYEVMFVVEGYQSSGNADIRMSMTEGTTPISRDLHISQSEKKQSGVFGSPIQTVLTHDRQSFTSNSSLNRSASLKVYNFLGREIVGQSENGYSSGKLFYIVKTAR